MKDISITSFKHFSMQEREHLQRLLDASDQVFANSLIEISHIKDSELELYDRNFLPHIEGLKYQFDKYTDGKHPDRCPGYFQVYNLKGILNSFQKCKLERPSCSAISMIYLKTFIYELHFFINTIGKICEDCEYFCNQRCGY